MELLYFTIIILSILLFVLTYRNSILNNLKELKLREIITDNGEILYMRLDKGEKIPGVRYLDYHIALYKENGENIFGVKQYKILETTRIHNSQYKQEKEIELGTIKFYTNQAVNNYERNTKNVHDLENWDGYIGEDTFKTKIMRNKKIKDLLNGNTDKLEEYLKD